MSVSVTLNGTSYTIPQSGETGWGSAVTSWIQAVSNSTLQKTGGSFLLTADVDFGATYGVKASAFKSRNSNPSSTGIVQLANAESVGWRNAANSSDLLLKVNASNQLEFNGNPITGSSALTANKAVVTGASGVLTTSSASDTEIGYLVGVSSAIQTQINTKITSGGGAIVDADVNASAAIARTKLASGSNNHVIINSGAGVLSSEATLAKSRGGTAQDNSSLTFPASGTLATLAGSEILTNKTLTGNTAVTLVSGAATVTLPTTTGTLATLANAETLSSKTLTAPIIDVISATDQGSTPATPSSGTTKIYSKTDGKIYKLLSSGAETEIGTGSGGGINYVSNPDFESATTGYAAYADAAAAAPVDGTGGSPTVTITRSTSSPLRGVGSGLITKDAANRQGEGVGYAFTISSADQAKTMQISFDYAVASGTFAGGTDAAVGDLVLYVYDVTNATLIQPTGYKILGSVSGQFYKHTAQFQTASNSVSYRLIWHVATTSTSAWTWKFDNVQCGPQTLSFGAPVTDWQSFTPVSSWVSNATHVGYWRRVGDSIEMNVQTTCSGAPTSATYTIALPNGLTIDATKLGPSSSQNQTNGVGYISGSSSYITVVPTYNTSTTLRIVYASTLGSLGAVTQALPITWANTNTLGFFARFPVTGWGSSVLISSDTDTRVVAATLGLNSTFAPGAGAPIKYDTVIKDTHNAYSASTGLYTIPVSGLYAVSVVTLVSASTSNVSLALNGTSKIYLATAVATGFAAGSAVYSFNAGDTLSINSAAAVTFSAISSSIYQNSLSIQRVSGPSQIAAADTVAFQAGGALPTGTFGAAHNNVIYGTVEKDSHGAYNNATGTYTVPVSGTYLVSAGWMASAAARVAGNGNVLSMAVNGTKKRAEKRISWGTSTAATAVSMSTTYKFVAGDTINITSYSDDTTPAYNNGDNANYFTVTRLGN